VGAFLFYCALDMAADRGGNAYVITKPAPGVGLGSTTLLFVASGSSTAATLQTGAIDDVAAPVQ